MVDFLKSEVDFAGKSVTIQVRPGVYPGFQLHGQFVGEGTEPLHIVGDPAAPEKVVVHGVNADALALKASRLHVSGVTFQTSGKKGHGWRLGQHAFLSHDNCRFGGCVHDMIAAQDGSVAVAEGPLTVAGGAVSFVHPTRRSLVSFDRQTVRFEGTPVFSVYVVGVNDATASFATSELIGDKKGRTVVHIGGMLNLASAKGKIFGTSNGPEVGAGGNIVYWPPQDTIWVRQDGSDHNDGYQNTADRAFRTPAAAIDWLVRRPYSATNSRTPTVRLGPGTWGPVELRNVPNVDHAILEGDMAMPSKTSICGDRGPSIVCNHVHTHWIVQGIKLPSAQGNDIAPPMRSRVSIGKLTSVPAAAAKSLRVAEATSK